MDGCNGISCIFVRPTIKRKKLIKTLGRIVRWILGIAAFIYLGTIILLEMPAVQQRLTSFATRKLKEALRTELSVGRISFGLFNRIIIDGLSVCDRSGKEAISVSRLSVKMEIAPLLQGKVSISNVQLFGFRIAVTQDDRQSDPNILFIIEAFRPEQPRLKIEDVRVNSILMRRGQVSYDVASVPETPGVFNPQHIDIKNLTANISLKALSKDSVNAAIKRMSFHEQSGFSLQKLAAKLTANSRHACLENFLLHLPGTSFRLDTLRADYEGIRAFAHFMDSVRFSGHILPSRIAPGDFACFTPALRHFKDTLNLQAAFTGSGNRLRCSHFAIQAGTGIRLKGQASFNGLSRGTSARASGQITELSIRQEGSEYLFRNLLAKPAPAALQRAGDIRFNGTFGGQLDHLGLAGTFRTDAGNITANLSMSADKAARHAAVSGTIHTEDLDLGRISGKPGVLGKACLNTHVQMEKRGEQPPFINVDGLVSSIEIKQYNYKNIRLDGIYHQKSFDGSIQLDDPNGHVAMDGNINLAGEIPEFHFNARLGKVRLHDLHLASRYPDMEMSWRMNVNFKGNSPDNMEGDIRIDSIFFKDAARELSISHVDIAARPQSNGEKLLTLDSPYATATVKGRYRYHTIPASIIKTVERYIPSLLSLNKEIAEPANNFSFDLHVYNTDDIAGMFGLPFSIYSHAVAKGYFNDIAQKLRIESYLPAFRYGNTRFESGMVLCENPADLFKCLARASMKMKSNAIFNVSIDTRAGNDRVAASVNWGNNAEATYSGQLKASAHLAKDGRAEPGIKADIRILPTRIILNDSIWNIHPSRVAVDSGLVRIDNFLFRHGEQYIKIHGNLTERPADTVKVQLNDINMGYVFDIVRLKDVSFNGRATGTATASHVFHDPSLQADLHIRDFRFNNGLMGDMQVTGRWDKEQEGIYLDARAQEPGISRTRVAGFIYPKKKGLELDIEADSTNLQFLQYYMRNIASDVHGRMNGHARFYGGFKSLMLDGDVYADASMKFDVLGATFQVRDSIHLRPSEIRFDNCALRDPEGHRGRLNGYLRHQHFKDLSYRFLIDIENMLVFNTQEDPEMPFYGTLYGTGNALLNGSKAGLNVDAAVTTNANSRFTYMLKPAASATNSQFVTFIDKTPRREMHDSIFVAESYLEQEEETIEAAPVDIRLNLLVDATPDATMKIIMDPIAGDYISGKGNGNIRVEFFNKGDVKMFGSYNIDQGIYKFSLQEVIRKDFLIKSGSSIEFNGSPLDANLGIQASYTVNSASLSDLGIGETFSQNNVKVNCLMNITGNLTHPNVGFDIELPNVSEEEREIVRSAISTDEEMNMQMLYLLGVGKFYTYDYGNNAGQSSNTMSSVLSSTLSGQLNNMLSQALNLQNWNFGTTLSTGEEGWTDVEVEGMLSAQLLDNRLLINGNFGYRDNPMANTNFIGDFDVEWLLTKSGEIRLKAYNKTNDRYYTKTTLTTQGVGIAYKKDFNAWRDIISWKGRIGRRRRKAQADSIASTPPGTEAAGLKPRGEEAPATQAGSRRLPTTGAKGQAIREDS